MGRYSGPVCKLCRRAGLKLFLKGDRCLMAKCPVETGRPPPGMHGGGGQRRSKLSDYGIQLREKQRLRRYYGLNEGQFRLFFERAVRRRGVTGERLLQLLELRLDNVVFRLNLVPSRPAARQFVRHNHVAVNGQRTNIPSMVLKEGATVSVADEAGRALAKSWVEAGESRGLSSWLALDRETLTGTVVRTPTREEIAPFVNEQLVVELYSK